MRRRLAADLPRVWDAPTTSDRDRKQLLRCLLDDVVLTVDREHHARVELFWQGGAHTELPIALNRTPAKRTTTPDDLIDLIRRLAEHSSDREIAMILAKQDHPHRDRTAIHRHPRRGHSRTRRHPRRPTACRRQ